MKAVILAFVFCTALSVRVFFRRPLTSHLSAEPQLLQLSTEPDDPSAGWVCLDDGENTGISDTQLGDPPADVAAVAPACAAASSSAIVPYESPGAAAANSSTVVLVDPRLAKGRKPWEEVGRFPRRGTAEDQESLRAAARRIAESEGWAITTPINSGAHGNPTAVIANCAICGLGCTQQWRFSFINRCTVLAESHGQCPRPEDTESALSELHSKRRKLNNAKKYREYTPHEAFKVMERERVPLEERPSERQLEQQRRGVASGPSRYPAHTIGLLRRFLENPPEGVHIFFEDVVLTTEVVRIPFTGSLMWETGAETFASLQNLLFDYTFATNRHGLLLGAIGGCGLHLSARTHLLAMRFVPAVFCISTSEDEEAHAILLRLYETLRSQAVVEPLPLSDAYLDFACLTSAVKYFGDRRVYLHRDLQHVKTDIKKEAKIKDKVSGNTRLRRAEFLPVLISFVEWSCFLPNDLEFHAFWDAVLTRMRGTTLETDFNEPDMADYLQQHIFDFSAGYWRASWQSGLGAVPNGYTTYAGNCIERNHRTVKDLMAGGYQTQELSALVEEVCDIINSRCRSGFYADVKPTVKVVPPMLIEARAKKTEKLQEEEDETETCGRYLDFTSIVTHFRKHGATGTYLAFPCSRSFADGSEATVLYIIPRAKLNRVVSGHADDSREEMQRMVRLACAATLQDVHNACASPQGTYDIMAHMRMRRIYAVVWRGEGFVKDEGKPFVENGGYSAHAEFVQALQQKEFLQEVPSGPQRAAKDTSGKRKSRYSESLRRMLAAPHALPSTVASPNQVCAQAAAPKEALVVKASAHFCSFRTTTGKRCRKPRKNGLFCPNHEKFFNSDRVASSLRRHFQASVAHRMAPAALEKWMLDSS